jgi:hypothetical protein
MTEWTEVFAGYRRKAEIFDLHVWPKNNTHDPYQAWAVISEDGNSTVLPCKSGFESLQDAKGWIEGAMLELCEAVQSDLGKSRNEHDNTCCGDCGPKG